MFKKISIFIFLFLLLLAIGTVSAVDDVNITSSNNDVGSDVLEMSDCQEDINILSKSSHTVNSGNYNNYFDGNGNLNSTSVKEGDTIILNGDFSKKNFIFNKKLNIEGGSANSLNGVKVILLSGASNSTVSNLKITNNDDFEYGIFLNGASYCVISNCVIKNKGKSSFPIVLGNGANHNNVTNNKLTTHGITYGHGTRSTSPMLISGSHYNYIANNMIHSADANGIYLSDYKTEVVSGGKSNYNTIFNNTVIYDVLPTSWSYGIQLMGDNNIADSNKIIGGYRGISSAGVNNKIINNFIVNLTGADFNHPGVEIGGEYGIVGGINAIIKNNTILNANLLANGAGIFISDNGIIENNRIHIKLNGIGVYADGNNIKVLNNKINTTRGYGIFQIGALYGLNVTKNIINSASAIGIALFRSSQSRMPTNVTIINNTIITTNDIAIDASQVNKKGIFIQTMNNVGNKKILTPEGVYDPLAPSYNFNGTTYNITNDTYHSYFDSNGRIIANITDGDILNFSGVFHNHIMYINFGVKITGNNPIFYNTTFVISCENVWVEKIKIINKDASRINAWGILVNKDSGVKIINCTISVDDKNAAYAIYILESSYVDVINNTLYSSGNYLTFTLLAYGAEKCNFVNNTIFTNGSGEVYSFESSKCLDGSCLDGNSSTTGNHIVNEIYRTYGILMIRSSYNNVTGNIVNVTSKLNQTYSTTGENNSTNSIVGIDLYFDSHYNTFNENNVFVKGFDNYIYGMGVLGTETGMVGSQEHGASYNKFINNNITLEGTFFATGFIAGNDAKNTTVKGNIINLRSNDFVYGITLEISQQSYVIANNLTLNSQIVYGMSIYSSNKNQIKTNIIDAKSKVVLGLGLSNSNYNIINNNTIIANGSGEEVNIPFNNTKFYNAGIAVEGNSNNNLINSNNVISNKGFAVDLDGFAFNNTVFDNYLVSQKGKADGAVNNSDGNIVLENYYKFISGTFPNVNMLYLEEGVFKLILNETVTGGTVIFKDTNGDEIGTSNVIGNSTSIKIRLDEGYSPTQYSITATFKLKDYKTTIFDSMLYIERGKLNIVVTPISVKQGLDAIFTVKVTNILGNPVSGIKISFNRPSGSNSYITSSTTDKYGVAKSIAKIEFNNPYFVAVSDKSNDLYESYSANIPVTYLDKAPVTIKINSQVSPGGVLLQVVDNNGLPLKDKLTNAGIKVVVTISGKKYALKPDSNGQIYLPGSITKAKSYSVKVSYDGNIYYKSAYKSANFKVLSIITGSKNIVKYFGNSIQHKVRIMASNGKYVGSGVNVIFKVGSKSYTVKTDKDGYAAKSFKLKVGKYTVTTTCKGQSVSHKLTFKPTLTAKNIVGKKSKDTKFTVKLVNKDGKVLSGKKISIKVNGKNYKVKTNKKGVATLKLKLKKIGKYSAISSYGGCKITNKITIKK